MRISPIGTQYVRQNNAKSKNPSFGKFCGIDEKLINKFTTHELEVLKGEARRFVDSKFCNIKYVKDSYFDTEHVAIELKSSPKLNIEPIKIDEEYPINAADIGWKRISSANCSVYRPYCLDFVAYEDRRPIQYFLPDIDIEIKNTFDNNVSRIRNKFQHYSHLRHAYNIWEGLAFANAYEAYWNFLEREAAKKIDLANEFKKLTNM